MTTFRDQLRLTLADRHSPEAAALLSTLLRYVANRVQQVARGRAHGLLSPSEVEEVTSEVMMALMTSGLTNFHGDSMPELLAYVRTATDRTAWRAASRRLRERDAVADMCSADQSAWRPLSCVGPDVELNAESPLPAADKHFLTALLEAGSMANLARARSVSRAAITLRVQRIRARIAELDTPKRSAHDAWILQVARRVEIGG